MYVRYVAEEMDCRFFKEGYIYAYIAVYIDVFCCFSGAHGKYDVSVRADIHVVGSALGACVCE